MLTYGGHDFRKKTVEKPVHDPPPWRECQVTYNALSLKRNLPFLSGLSDGKGLKNQTTKPPGQHQIPTNSISQPAIKTKPPTVPHHHVVIAVKSIRSIFSQRFFRSWGWLCSPSLVEQAPLYNLRGRALLAQPPPVAWAAIGFGWFR